MGVWRVVREGDGIQLQTYYEDENRWLWVRLSRAQLLTLIDALNEVVGK
jgi:hypothetical protein